ncbi:hypothetical protein BO82DRAFT_369140 [Aspergillus uvarum CBS 121591]|uniref:Zn(2)-C6 fungal-type domain-containing protein n=1 Tax=Aspergillus uvarum CBS 121591 TaxID=1448315 RepID=A0A319CDG3_9EURO|nr:hypothetical protein BO82DRAFT_369140 [Aspergillus uvarum CBS 121591]PYH76653.1 hypothetical protein BO82DRAFT_369140 [Aspergillus uvarum CBS 121591]
MLRFWAWLLWVVTGRAFVSIKVAAAPTRETARAPSLPPQRAGPLADQALLDLQSLPQWQSKRDRDRDNFVTGPKTDVELVAITICRARHVKCDETPGVCNQCTSTGRHCEYDASRLPRISGAIARAIWPQSVVQVAPTARPDTSTDEQRCFSIFFHQTAPRMADWFNLEAWQRIVLQISLAEPAAYHAAVALSALHEDVEMRGLCRAGNYKSASVHLRRGVQLVEQRDGYWRHHPRQGSHPTAQLRYGSATEAALVQAFMVLDVQITQYEQSDPLTLEQSTDQDAYPSETRSHGSLMHKKSTDQDTSLTRFNSLGSNAFGSLLEARQRINIIMSKVSHFRGSCNALLHDNTGEQAVMQRVTAQQAIMLARLSEFAASFEELVARHDPGSLSEEESRNIALLRLQHLSLVNLVVQNLAALKVVSNHDPTK